MLAVILAILGILVAIGIPLEVERRKRPALRIDRADDLNAASARPTPLRIVHVRVTNLPTTGWISKWLLRDVASGCRVNVTFRSRSDGATLDIPGRWSGHPEPLSFEVLPTLQFAAMFRPEAVPSTLVMELAPDTQGQGLGIAIKREGSASAFAFTSESYRDPVGMCLPKFELPHTEYEVEVRAHTGQVSVVRKFVLRNEGTAYTGLSLSEIT